MIIPFLGDFKVKDAFITTFYSYPKRPSVVLNHEDEKETFSDEDLGDKSKAICILEESSLKIFYEKGDDFLVNVPFEVRKCWPAKYINYL